MKLDHRSTQQPRLWQQRLDTTWAVFSSDQVSLRRTHSASNTQCRVLASCWTSSPNKQASHASKITWTLAPTRCFFQSRLGQTLVDANLKFHLSLFLLLQVWTRWQVTRKTHIFKMFTCTLCVHVQYVHMHVWYKCMYIYIHRERERHITYIHHITSHYSALHCITLHYTAFHYITLHYIHAHAYMHTDASMYLYMYIYIYVLYCCAYVHVRWGRYFDYSVHSKPNLGFSPWNCSRAPPVKSKGFTGPRAFKIN